MDRRRDPPGKGTLAAGGANLYGFAPTLDPDDLLREGGEFVAVHHVGVGSTHRCVQLVDAWWTHVVLRSGCLFDRESRMTTVSQEGVTHFRDSTQARPPPDRGDRTAKRRLD
ncbi:MAG: hypothetical protein WKF60_11130 [Ilumatobacter sp.]